MDTKKIKHCGNKKISSQNYDDGRSARRNNKNDRVLPPIILLKPKSKPDDQEKSNNSTITIASKGASVTKLEVQNKHRTKLEVPFVTSVSMSNIVYLIGAQNTLNSEAVDFLMENNTDFFVVGAVGPQSTGKSTILNFLAAEESKLLPYRKYFPETNSFPFPDSAEVGEDMPMFITKDRIILLESTPVLVNRTKKDFIVSELDDIRRIILLMNICHVLLVTQEESLNANFIRLLLCAEMMLPRNKISPKPKIVLVKNKCNKLFFSDSEKAIHQSVYKQLFKNSNLDIFTNMSDTLQIDIAYLPNLNDNSLITDDKVSMACIRKFRQHIFMTPRQNKIANSQEVLTEKMWSQVISNVLEGHSNSYFLCKYENLKEKYNLHNHVNVVENTESTLPRTIPKEP